MHSAVLSGLLGPGACLPVAVSAAESPCGTAEHRQFDFRIGDWVVRTRDGKLAGRDRIERDFDGCALRERYSTERGYRGESLNAYDPGRQRWHQTWIDNTGTVLLLDGALQGGRMVLEGSAVGADGRTTRHRISWTPNPDGNVRQLWETTDASGNSRTLFDGLYSRQ